MGNTTVKDVIVETKDNKLARLRREYILEHWPLFLNEFPGLPGFINEGSFEQRALKMLELGKAAQVSVTGSPWAEDDLDTLLSRPPKDFLTYLKSEYNRKQLANTWRTTRDQLLMDMED